VLGRAAGEVQDEAGVAGEVTDCRIDLGEGDLHNYKFTGEPSLRCGIFVLQCSEQLKLLP
jgi:hypothetical protein